MNTLHNIKLLSSEDLLLYFDVLEKIGIELIHKDHCINKLLKGKTLNIYLGFELSGPMHLGHVCTLSVLAYLSEFSNVNAMLLFSEFHAVSNNKTINYSAYINAKKIPALKKCNFILSSSSKYLDNDKLIKVTDSYTNFMDTGLYKDMCLNLFSKIKIKKVIKACGFFDRTDFKNLNISQVLYAPYQAVDIDYLDVDLVIGGSDQRKIHMFHSDHCEKYVTYMHLPLLTIDEQKMSKSEPEKCIYVDNFLYQAYMNLDEKLKTLIKNRIETCYKKDIKEYLNMFKI